MSERPRVALVVDHPQRDLPGLVLTAYRLWEAGVDVLLVPLNVLGGEVFSLLPDFVALNYLRTTIEPVLRGCVEVGIPYGVIETEGGLYGTLDNYLRVWPASPELRDAVRVMCVWGRRTRDYMIERQALRPDQMAVTGVPRFDFYNQRWRSFFDAEPRFSDKPLVLVNTKVAIANPQHHSVEREMAMYIDKLGFSHEEVEHLRRMGVENIDATIGLTNDLAARHPTMAFVLRPHPHERLSTYEERVTALPNLAVVRTGTVDRWLVQSAALVHRQCTTAIEAGLAGVPAIAPLWVPTASDAPDTELVSLRLRSPADLDDTLDAVIRGENVVPAAAESELERIIEEWLCANDGASNERVAEALLAALPGERRPDPAAAERHFFRLVEPVTGRKGVVGRLAHSAGTLGARRFWAGVAQPASRNWESTAKAYTADGVADMLRRIHGLVSPGAGGPRVEGARDAGLYRYGYAGHSVLVGR